MTRKRFDGQHCYEDDTPRASRRISRLQASIYITRLFHFGRGWSRNPICKFGTRERRAIGVFEYNRPSIVIVNALSVGFHVRRAGASWPKNSMTVIIAFAFLVRPMADKWIKFPSTHERRHDRINYSWRSFVLLHDAPNYNTVTTL